MHYKNKELDLYRKLNITKMNIAVKNSLLLKDSMEAIEKISESQAVLMAKSYETLERLKKANKEFREFLNASKC